MWLGPNPVVVTEPATYDPADGDGMAHSLEIRDGSPVKQRSRLVVTRRLVELLGSRGPEGPLAAAGPVASRALVKLASRVLALDGEGLGYRLGLDLSTACVEDFDAMLTSPMGIHVVVDPDTGDAHFVGVDPLGPPWLRLHRLRSDGFLTSSTAIEEPSFVAEPALGLTRGSIVLAESSLSSAPLRGADDVLGPLRFDLDRAPRLGIVSLDDPGAGCTWVTSEPGHVVVIAATRDEPLGPSCFTLRSAPERSPDPDWWPPQRSGRLERIDTNGVGHGAIIERLDDLVLDALDGDPLCHQADRRFLYAVTAARAGDEGALLVKYDLVTGTSERRAVPAHLVVDAPQFVRDPEGRTDEEGWVVLPALDRTDQRSQLIVLDATSFSARPTSIVTLPERLPMGIRGIFLAPHEYR
jgi:carotenoid cleavage dioxygenase